MPRHGALGQAIPIIFRPAKLMDQRPQNQGGIRCPPDQHHIHVQRQGVGHAARAEIGVGRNYVAILQADAFHDR